MIFRFSKPQSIIATSKYHMNQPNQNDTVWLDDGEEAIYIAKADDRHAVRPVYESGEFGRVTLVSAVHLSPPEPKRHKEIADLEAKIQEKRSELSAIYTQLREAEERNKWLKSILAQNAALERVGNFIEGKFTHFVIQEYDGIKIKDRSVIDETDDYGKVRGMKLLTLFGQTNGDLGWRLNAYSDGSGYTKEVYPCFSEEDANEIAKGLVKKSIDEIKDPSCVRDSTIKDAKRFGIEVPAHIESAILEIKRKRIAERRQKAKAELEKITQEAASVGLN